MKQINTIFLCLGDSLTAGFPGYDPSDDGISEGYGNKQSQYEYWLKSLCLEHFQKKFGLLNENIINNLMFVNRGILGELTSDLLRRVNYEILKTKPKPNYTIIIEGTNDLGWGIPIEEIFSNIKELHEISREFDITSIGATIPPIVVETSSPSYNRKKVELNKKLVEFFNKNSILFADLYNGMMDKNGNLKNECAINDGLHFSVEGYKQMGTVIFQDALEKIIEKGIEEKKGI